MRLVGCAVVSVALNGGGYADVISGSPGEDLENAADTGLFHPSESSAGAPGRPSPSPHTARLRSANSPPARAASVHSAMMPRPVHGP